MIKYFFKFVEIQTKTISVISFVIAVLFYINYLAPEYGIDVINFVIFFLSMLCIDMFTTAINHIAAYYKEKQKTKYDQDLIKAMREHNYTMKTNVYIILALMAVFSSLGIILVIRSNVGVLLLGMLCVLIGIVYSLGKKPISYTPFGEIFAGGAMGVILPVIVVFTQFDSLPFELNPLLAITFLPLAFFIGNILFANNLCDLEMDVYNNRYTLAYYTKRPLGVKLLHLSNLGAMVAITVASLLGFIPQYFNLIYLVLIILTRNVILFSKKFDKTTSFPLILKNYIIFFIVYALFFIIDIVINFVF